MVISVQDLLKLPVVMEDLLALALFSITLLLLVLSDDGLLYL